MDWTNILIQRHMQWCMWCVKRERLSLWWAGGSGGLGEGGWGQRTVVRAEIGRLAAGWECLGFMGAAAKAHGEEDGGWWGDTSEPSPPSTHTHTHTHTLWDIIIPLYCELAGEQAPFSSPSAWLWMGMLHESLSLLSARSVPCAETGRSIHALSLILSH